MINGHGNNLYEYEAGRIVSDFSSNIAFNHCSESILEYIKQKIDTIGNYPDPSAVRLTHQIADHHSVDPKSVLVTNGSAEAFYIIAHYQQGARTAICIPAFAEYEDACRLYRHSMDFVPIKDFRNADFSAYHSVWLANPNNPDGTITRGEDIKRQCLANPQTHFVIDEAYCELTSRGEDIMWQKGAAIFSNLIRIGSLTKSFAIPGIRLGYIIARPNIIEQISVMRPPWTVNALALEAGTYIMDNYGRLLPDIQELTDISRFLQEELERVPSVEVVPSSCNFFLSKLKIDTATWLKSRLISDHGILIRDASNFRGLDSTYFRLAAQKMEQCTRLISAMKTILNDL